MVEEESVEETETFYAVPEVAAVDSKSLNDIAHEVIAGHWGRANVRNKRLSEAGYDPKEVRAEIDKIFKR